VQNSRLEPRVFQDAPWRYCTSSRAALLSSSSVPVLVRINGQKAILRSGVWRSADPRMEKMLNAATDSWIRQTGGPPLHDRDPERTVAESIVPRLGGRIVLRIPTRQDATRRHYLSRRQMDLFAP